MLYPVNDERGNREIQIAADSIETLRKCDVERVLVTDTGMIGLAVWIANKRPDLKDEVADVIAEFGWELDTLINRYEVSCKGCGCEPGDGVTAYCNDPEGCGFAKMEERREQLN